MNQLPNEIILMILNELDSLNALLKCRLVDRKWNELVKIIRIEFLQVGGRNPWDDVEMDQFSIDPHPIRFRTNRNDFMKPTLMKAILSRLKQVFFDRIEITTKPVWISFEKSLQQLR